MTGDQRARIEFAVGVGLLLFVATVLIGILVVGSPSARTPHGVFPPTTTTCCSGRCS